MWNRGVYAVIVRKFEKFLWQSIIWNLAGAFTMESFRQDSSLWTALSRCSSQQRKDDITSPPISFWKVEIFFANLGF